MPVELAAPLAKLVGIQIEQNGLLRDIFAEQMNCLGITMEMVAPQANRKKLRGEKKRSEEKLQRLGRRLEENQRELSKLLTELEALTTVS